MKAEEKLASLRKLLQEKGIVAMPGASNALFAKMIEREGFQALYISGAGIANSLGFPDTGIVTRPEVINYAKYIANAVNIPAVCDADTGFGEAKDVIRTVEEFEAAGISGIHIEDQEFPKKGGHLAGKVLVPVEEMVEKIKAAVKGRHDKNFLIVARTDAKAVEGFDKAVSRSKAYLDAGADAIFPEALESKEEFARFYKEVGGLLMANMTEFGKSPYFSTDDLAAMGYKMVIFPLAAFRAANKAAEAVIRTLKKEGTQKNIITGMQARKELYELLGYDGFKDSSKGEL